MTDLYSLLPPQMDELIGSLGAPRYRADQLLRALYREAPAAIDDIAILPKDIRYERGW